MSLNQSQILGKKTYLDTADGQQYLEQALEDGLFGELISFEDPSLENIFSNCKNWVKRLRNQLAEAAAKETGSPLKYHLADIEAIVQFLQTYTNLIPSQSEFIFAPKGKVFLILSANEPVILGSLPVLSALLAGNQVWVKPSSKTPTFAQMFTEGLLSCGVPPTQLQLIFPDQKQTQTLLSSAMFDRIISFAHSKTNAVFSQLVQPTSTEFIAENEGNDWAYIDQHPKMSISKIAQVLVHSFTKHNGQMCDAVRGVLVHQDQAEAIKQALTLKLQQLQPGDALNPTVDVGPVLPGTSSHLLQILKQTTAQKKVELKSKLAVSPTLIFEPDAKSKFLSQPLFGPVLWVKTVANFDEALAYYFATNKHGLSFSLFTDNQEQIATAIRKIPVSRINLNTDPVDVSVLSPWGGIKASGNDGPATWFEKCIQRKVLNHG